jgi:hypothetical protein
MEWLRSADVQVGDAHALSAVNTFQTYRARAIGISIVRALATIAFVGMHTTFMQVPPILSRSTMATFQPALARSIAGDFPAGSDVGPVRRGIGRGQRGSTVGGGGRA